MEDGLVMGRVHEFTKRCALFLLHFFTEMEGSVVFADPLLQQNELTGLAF
jgi:hypothetical protein